MQPLRANSWTNNGCAHFVYRSHVWGHTPAGAYAHMCSYLCRDRVKGSTSIIKSKSQKVLGSSRCKKFMCRGRLGNRRSEGKKDVVTFKNKKREKVRVERDVMENGIARRTLN